MKHNWEYKPFGKILKTITPTTKIEKSEYKTTGQYPIISQEDVFISGFWDNGDDITPHSTPVVIFGDHSRVLKYIDFDFVVGADGVKIIQPIGLLDAKFLYHFLRWYNVPSLGYSRHFKLLKEANYPVPPMEIQERIVAELDQINDLIAKKRELLSQLNTLAQSLFYDTFGDPISNPKGFSKKYLKEVSSVKIGPFGSLLHKEDYISGGTPLVNPIHMQNGYVVADNNFTIDDNKKETLSNYLLKCNDIVFGRRGDIGRCALITFSEDGYLCGTGSLFVRFTIPINSLFALWCFKQPTITKYLIEKAKGATMLNINCGIVESIPLILPPLALQEDFAAKVKVIEAQKAKVEAEIAELRTLLDARMDYWFN